jgi:hypothetical protein
MRKPKVEKTGIEIEKDVPLPTHRGKASPYPIAQLEPGESFYVKDKKISQMWNEIVRVKGQMPDKTRSFAVRTVDGGVRVWRTK